MLVICAGMYRAASTWQYNVAGYLAEKYRSGSRLGYLSGGHDLPEPWNSNRSSLGFGVLKVHERDPILSGLLEKGEAVALYSFRDLRDVAYSLVHKLQEPFATAIESSQIIEEAIANYQFWSRTPHTLTQQYESMVQEPVRAVVGIARHLDILLAEGVAEDIAAEFSLEKNRARAQEVARCCQSQGKDLKDTTNAMCRDEITQWHWNHIRDGRIGGWRASATPRELAVLARKCGAWLLERGYEKDFSWANGAMAYVLFEEHRELTHRLEQAHHQLENCQETRGCLMTRLQSQETVSRQLAARLHELESLGPIALDLARSMHQLSARHPRARSVFKKAYLSLSQILRHSQAG